MTNIPTGTASPAAVVSVKGLSVEITSGRRIVDDVTFHLGAGELLGLVGQSGSGKTTVATALLGYLRHGATQVAGRIRVGEVDVTAATSAQRRALRGRVIAYVPQDPRASLNPAMRIGAQLAEMLEGRDAAARGTAIAAALEEVGLPADEEFRARYPHQLSGGQLQRVGIAMAIIARPTVIVLDEPTTGLDVTTQARILRLVRQLCVDHGIAGLYVTHDLAVVAELVDRVLVMNEGRTVETGDLEDVFLRPQADYTRRLLAAAPDITDPGPAPVTERIGDENRHLVVDSLAAGYRRRPVLEQVDLDLAPGECLAVVGESGSGKSTLSRAIIGLHPEYTGTVSWANRELPHRAEKRDLRAVRELQYIFQSPFTALNPRKTVFRSIEFAHRQAFPRLARSERRRAELGALDRVGISEASADLLPNRLSGGERQRVAIARSLVTEPKVLICDEITSALDVLVQQSVIELLLRLQAEEGLALIFVTHNLALVKSVAHRVLVLDRGRVAELGPTEQILTDPQHEYTRTLLSHTLSIEHSLSARGQRAVVPAAMERTKIS